MKSILLGAIVVAGFSASPAAAAVVNMTVNGTVSFGRDDLGLFGQAGQFLAGSAYQMNFAFDVSNAANLGNSHQATGGTLFGRPSPVTRADILINGTTFSFINPYNAYYNTFSYPAFSQMDVGTGGPNGINGGGFSWSRSDQGIALALDTPVSRTFGAGDTVFSAFQQANQDQTAFTYLSLRPTDLNISVAGTAVPEPGTWAMMIAGFGVVGAAVRRRTRMSVRYA